MIQKFQEYWWEELMSCKNEKGGEMSKILRKTTKPSEKAKQKLKML